MKFIILQSERVWYFSIPLLITLIVCDLFELCRDAICIEPPDVVEDWDISALVIVQFASRVCRLDEESSQWIRMPTLYLYRGSCLFSNP